MNLIAQPFAARQRRPGATEPGDVDGGIIPGGLARRQIAPDFHRGFGLLDILQEREFAVIAAPAAGLEKFGEVLQPLLGKIAPARDDVAAPCHVQLMCHEPARKEKNGRRRNGHESIRRDRDILWKTFKLSSVYRLPDARHRQIAVEMRDFPLYPPSSGATAWRRCRGREFAGMGMAADFAERECPKYRQNERPVRGTTGRVKLYGRLGWMGARAEYSLDGEG